MIHPKMICRILGALLFIEAVFMAACLPFSLCYKENDLYPFLYAVGVAVAAGFILVLIGHTREKSISRRDGYVVVSLSWLVFSLIGAMPYYFSDYIPSYTDAFFETMSGFTTTGSSILNNIESLPHGLLFWRSLTQWVGGLGIIIFTIAVLPIFGAGDVFLFAAEATGPLHGKLHPRITVTARWILTVYIGITLLETLCLILAGMTSFDAICHSMTTTSTGGYSTRQASIAAYHSPLIEYIIAFFMFISGVNFPLLFCVAFRGQFKKLLGDGEFKTYFWITLLSTLVIAFTLFCTTTFTEEHSFREALFQVVSLITTTGFVSADYMLWPSFLWLILCALMICGACAGSTTGAMKCVRINILGKTIVNEFRHIVHPNAITPLRMGPVAIPQTVRSAVLAFTALYIVVIFAGWFTMMLFGLSFMDSFSVVISSLGNVGPGLGAFGPTFSWSALPPILKWEASFLMLIGRLELFSILLMFTPQFWRKQ